MLPYKEPAVIIHLTPYRETSKLVTLFSPQRGKFNAIAKGFSRLKGRWGGKLDLFCYGEAIFSAKKDATLVNLSDFVSEECFFPIRENLIKFKLASYFTEIISHVELAEPKPLFVLYLQALYYLKEREDFTCLQIYFEAILFDILGIFPQVDSCINCGNLLSSAKLFFSAKLGGELCKKCARPNISTSLYNRMSWQKLQELIAHPITELDKYHLTKSELAEIQTFCRRFLEYHLGGHFKSLENR